MKIYYPDNNYYSKNKCRNKKKVLFPLFLLLFFSSSIFAQSCKERVEKSGFIYRTIVDNIYAHSDSIRFIVSNPFNPDNPSIIFLQGSDNTPLVSYEDSVNFLLIPPFQVHAYKKQYNFICISKPYTPLCLEWSHIQNSTPTTTDLHLVDYLKYNFLDYYVCQLEQVINFLKKEYCSNAAIYLIGNSQGGNIAIKYSFLHPDNVQKLVLYSTSIFDRHYEEILECRLKADKNEISQEDAQNQIDNIYAKFQDLKTSVEDFNILQEADSLAKIYNPVGIYSRRNEYTFNFDTPFKYLIKLKLPILTVYGTADLKARNCEQLPFFFIQESKENLTMMPILDCNHFFVKKIKDSDNKIISEEYVGDSVFSKIEQWLSK